MSTKTVNTGSTMMSNESSGGASSVMSESSSIGSFSTTVRMPNGLVISSSHMMEILKRILKCEDLRHKMTVYKRCFKVDDAINAFRVAFPKEIASEESAIAFGRMLQRARLMTHVCDSKKAFRSGNYFFRLQCYQEPEVLNSYLIYSTASDEEPMDLIGEMASLLYQVEHASASPETGLVDYRVAHKSQYYPMLQESVCKLQGLDIASLDEMTRMAIVINIYNIMMRYAFMKVGVPDGRSSRSHFFSDLKINVGDDLLSFDDLEHGILRANHPQYGSQSPQFGSKDHRVRLALSQIDPRIHFALSCSPLITHKVSIIDPNKLHYDLQREARKYLNKHTNLTIDLSNKTLQVSKIFYWYTSDFCNGDWTRIAQLMERNLTDDKRKAMHAMVTSGSQPKISYLNVDYGTQGGNFFAFKPSLLKANERRIL